MLPFDPAVTTAPSGGDIGTYVFYAVGALATLVTGIIVKGKRTRPPEDPESSPARIRERLTAAETSITEHGRRLDNHDEQLALTRAADVVLESEAARQRRRRTDR